jgi:hypothetical protein
MYANRRRARSCVSGDSVMRDVMTEMRDLHISILRAGAFWMRLSHVVEDLGFRLTYGTRAPVTNTDKTEAKGRTIASE